MKCSTRLLRGHVRPSKTLPTIPTNSSISASRTYIFHLHRRQAPSPPCLRQYLPPGKSHPSRQFSTSTLTTILLPPTIFTGLLISLWTYKCLMMVVFQNKIIYMPGVPPFSRSEKVDDYAAQCRPVVWTEHAIKSGDGTVVKLLEGNVQRDQEERVMGRRVVVVYFQGNASSLPPRLPYLSRILTTASSIPPADTNTQFTLIALSYRGFWTSSGRPTQAGIELDTAATLSWVLSRYPEPNTQIVVWGQSIGAGAATVSLANLSTSSPDGPARLSRISGLVLETPFVDLRAMLVALYPQKFLPYRYLAPFLRSTWDSKTALTVVGGLKPRLKVLMLQAGDDELVPEDNAPLLERVCRDRGVDVERVVVAGALHTEVMVKPQGRAKISRFIGSFG